MFSRIATCKRSFLVLPFLLSFVLGGQALVSSDTRQAGQLRLLSAYLATPNRTISATIKFKEPIDERSLSQMDLKAQVTTLWIGEVVNGEVRTSNQPVHEDETPLSAFQRYRELVDKMSEILERTKPSPDIEIAKSHDYAVYGVSVLGTPKQIMETQDGLPESEIIEVSADGKSPSLLPSVTAAPPVVALADPNKQFLPNRGSIEIRQLQPGYRYVLNWFSWDGWSTLSGFNSDEAYEHETVLNKYDGRAYLGRTVNWSANFAWGYLDTQALNNPQEPDWTVGCYRPKETFIPGAWYYSWIVTEEGNASPTGTNPVADSAKLSGEAKVRYCDFNPWCVAGSQRGYGRMIPAWQVAVPGYQQWYFAPVLAPEITDVNPKTIPVGVDRTLTISGKNFSQTFGAKVIVNGQTFPIYPGAQTRFLSADQVQLTVRIGSPSSPTTPFSIKIVNIVDTESGHQERESQPYTGLTAAGSSGGGGTTQTFSGSVGQGQWWERSFAISNTSLMRVALGWPSSADLDLFLVSPSGHVYGWNADTTGYSGYAVNPEFFNISNAQGGTWRVRVNGWSVSGSQSFTVTVQTQ